VTLILAASPLEGLGINTFAFLSQLVSFIIVLILLRKWALPVVQGMLDRRAAIIREGIENAERAREELKQATARAEQVLAEARREAQETIANAQRAAEREARRIEEEALARARQIEQQQVERIRQEAARARAELSRLVVNLSIAAASKVISKSVDSVDNRRLVEEFVSTSQATKGQ
jgi:F-type H+-transporting ATPase subunit b